MNFEKVMQTYILPICTGVIFGMVVTCAMWGNQTWLIFWAVLFLVISLYKIELKLEGA